MDVSKPMFFQSVVTALSNARRSTALVHTFFLKARLR